MPETYRVRIAKEELVFSAAHFITFGGNICERLHGHNYQVAAEVSGDLDENHYVIDFIALRDALKEILLTLDHRVLLPTKHTQIAVTQARGEITARFEDRRWVFPEGDCVLLPVENTTAELLACFLGSELLENLQKLGGNKLRMLSIAVDECNGQLGYWTKDL